MTRPLNILHLTTFYPPFSFGGDALYLYRLCRALGDLGHNVHVVHDVDAYHLLHPDPPEISYASHPNVTVHSLRSGFGLLSPLLTQQTGRAFLKRRQIEAVLKTQPFDVMHYHNISLLGPEVLALRSQQSAVVKLYTTHEHWLVCPTHVLWKFNERACEKPDCFRCTISARRPPQLWRQTDLLKRTGQHVDRFVSPSRFTARMHAQRGFPYPVGHLPYFVDRVDQDGQAPPPRSQARPYFLFVGRLERLKGLHTLIAAWQHVRDYDLLVAGTGGDEAALRAQAASNPQVKFLGPLSQQELGSLYAHAIATVVPSVTYETFGMIIIESFARQTPVIVRDLGALPEVVEESNGGFIYRNDRELLCAMQRLATEPALRNELGRNGYRAFLKNWTREAHLERYMELLRTTAEQKHGRVPWDN